MVELLVYIIIFTLLIVVIANVFFALSGSQRHIKALRTIESSAIVSLERIHRTIRDATSIDTGSSVLGSHPGKLVLIGVDENDIPLTTEIFLSGGVIRVKENTVDIGPLTSARALVSNLTFARINTGSFEAVKIELQLQSGTSTYLKTKNFYMTAALRNSY